MLWEDSDFSEAIDSSELDEGNDANSLSLSTGVLWEDSDFSELDEASLLDNPLGTVTPSYVFFLGSEDLSLSIDSSDELVSPPSKSIPKPFLSPPSKSTPKPFLSPPSNSSSSSPSSKNKLNAPLGLLISIVLNLLYWISSSSGSIDGTSELAADSSDDEIISSISISSFSPEEHNLLISLTG